MNSLEMELGKRKEYLEKTQRLAQKQLNRIQEGKLYIYQDKNGLRYYYSNKSTKNKRRYIRRKNIKKIRNLAQREYLEKILEETRNQLVLLKDFCEKIDFDLEKTAKDKMIFDKREWIEPLYLDDQSYAERWMEIRYEGNSYREDEKIVCTNRNEMVRSKAEKIIADKLDEMGIPYKYEHPLSIAGKGIVYPDFTILDVKNRKEVYIELFGMMDNPEYCAKAIKKINTYEKAGIHQGKNLLCVFETSKIIIDPQVFEDMILSVLE